MILISLAVIYISFITLLWGKMLFSTLGKLTQEPPIEKELTITCFSGLAVTGILISIIHLFVPISGPLVHILIIAPALLYCIFSSTCRSSIRDSFYLQFNKTGKITWLFLVSCLFVILVMSPYPIGHPDSLTYHIQCIRWMQQYPIVPGLANLQIHYGLQSTWFGLCSFFDLSYWHNEGLVYINATVVIWFILFIVGRIREKEHPLEALCWLFVLMACYGSYPMVRLTATSVSPDFIVAIYLILTFYIYLSNKPLKSESLLHLMMILSLFIITVKLSALFIVPFALFGFYFNRPTSKRWWAPLLYLIIIISPFLYQNALTSGYVLFPSEFPDIINADWKVPREILISTSLYIKSYAQFQGSIPSGNLSSKEWYAWIPRWWLVQSLANKTIILSLLLSYAGLLFVSRSTWKQNPHYFRALIFATAALVFWWVKAPDLRFGAGFILSILIINLYLIIKTLVTDSLKVSSKWINIPLVICSAILLSYSIYRLTNLFHASLFFSPAGVVSTEYKQIQHGGYNFSVPVNNGCGDAPLPCIYNDSIFYFHFRGETIKDGFKPAR